MERGRGDQEMANVKTLVLDASVIVKWFNREEDTEKALQVEELYEKGSMKGAPSQRITMTHIHTEISLD